MKRLHQAWEEVNDQGFHFAEKVEWTVVDVDLGAQALASSGC